MTKFEKILQRRLRASRLAVVLVLGFTFLFIRFCYNDVDPFAQYAGNTMPCSPSRINKYAIKPPPAQDGRFLANLWHTLQPLFDQHKPDPAHIKKPLVDKLPDKDILGDFFNLTNEEAENTRAKHMELVGKLPPYPKGHFGGRGVVVLAGGRYSEFAATSIGMLRESGSKLPVEVWLNDDGDEAWCNELPLEGMVCRRLTDYMNLDDLPHPYQWKVFTMLYSTFEDILFIDADSIPIKNPDFLFDSAVYKNYGVILWPDYWKHTGSPLLPYLIGINSTRQSDILASETSVESGQLVWNKKTHWKSLLLAAYYNYFGPDFWYTVFNNGWQGWGDKDTFPAALKAAQQDYYQVSHEIVTLFVQGTSDGIGMLQPDPTNNAKHMPLFLHTNMIKWGARELLCTENCDKIKGQGGHPFHMIDERSQIYKHLREGMRIFAVGQLFQGNIDPEPDMWRVVEHNACRTSRASWHMCKNARSHMERTFGFDFTEYREEMNEGGNANTQICIEGPWAKPSRAKPKPKNWAKDYEETYE
ncbi:hypothetical protein H634G_02077 [Metarhizium anisopliae BRIP 53293]|uniref:Alpha-1,2-mannosyltransferase n=1 Tax=Metarhizium anisopliae BRIP 53293 TaxID=1291518 RepID=A0A0D9P8N1_METAN|nr:hypothetical protein H634G_02077 [Metarhizium anisopliae BRIP 53293]KJK89663.1 hypothetical protein H633G_06408 [Metarhizium anisopliae BRIP 53284]